MNQNPRPSRLSPSASSTPTETLPSDSTYLQGLAWAWLAEARGDFITWVGGNPALADEAWEYSVVDAAQVYRVRRFMERDDDE